MIFSMWTGPPVVVIDFIMFCMVLKCCGLACRVSSVSSHSTTKIVTSSHPPNVPTHPHKSLCPVSQFPDLFLAHRLHHFFAEIPCQGRHGAALQR